MHGICHVARSCSIPRSRIKPEPVQFSLLRRQTLLVRNKSLRCRTAGIEQRRAQLIIARASETQRPAFSNSIMSISWHGHHRSGWRFRFHFPPPTPLPSTRVFGRSLPPGCQRDARRVQRINSGQGILCLSQQHILFSPPRAPQEYLPPHVLTSLLSVSNMCRWRQVCHVYLQCGHMVNVPDVLIQCDSRNCKFSPNHPADCKPPSCTRTCAQYRGYPEQYSPNINGLCPSCASGRR
ncbi:hypothetical protein PLICRDRAFT_41129 [Plicaturopsis crispa FD-325 SS-3]|nr:hypothetical protein PLICRDRAFT_41129 [Plicaturopsis crispa FD-325 SS-3]